MTNQEIINFLYYLWDKIDPAYKTETDKTIKEVIDKLKTEEVSNEQNRN